MKKIRKSIYRNKNRIISAALVMTFLVSLPAVGFIPEEWTGSYKVFATAAAEKKKNDAKKNLADVNSDIQDTKDAQDDLKQQIDDKKSEQKKLETSIAKKNEELNVVLAELEELQNKIDKKQDEIKQATEDLKVAQDTLDKEYESMKLRIQFMYENNQENSLWTAIFEANGLADLLNRVEYISDVYESDRELMNEYQLTLQKVEDLNTQLALEMDELQELQTETEAKEADIQKKLQALKTEETQLASSISNMEEDQKKYASQLTRLETAKGQYEKTISEQEEIIRNLEAAAAQQDAATYDGGGSGAANSMGNASYLTDDSNNPAPSGNVSGSDIVSYASQFVGNPYQWGGNSLTKGVDCSGFVHQVYAHFGISTPRYSQAFKSVGKAVSYNNIQPGDVVVYPGHVAIYAGGGVIVEAQSKRAGITRGRSVNCHKITAIRRLV